jgi:hypothetical protein
MFSGCKAIKYKQLLTTDLLALALMKNAAKLLGHTIKLIRPPQETKG